MFKHQNSYVKKVFSGDFPKEALHKMSRKRLEKFVLQLVECSSDMGAKDAKDFPGLYRGLCLKEINKPEWWPSERIIAQSLTSDGKYFMELLRFLVYKCCEFFKKPSGGNLNDKVFVTENDENCRGVKRKTDIELPPSKRRTLMPKNVTPKTDLSTTITSSETDTLLKTPIIPLKDILYNPKPKPRTQDEFLTIFDLQNTFSPNIDDIILVPPTQTSSIKFNTSSNIPFSSDLGLELMKRDNHVCPEIMKTRRLERLERYVNKTPPRVNEVQFEVSYQEKKDRTFRTYRFPKRQFWQRPGDVEYQKRVLVCQMLNVVLVRENLVALQEDVRNKSKRHLTIVVSRICDEDDDEKTSICSL